MPGSKSVVTVPRREIARPTEEAKCPQVVFSMALVLLGLIAPGCARLSRKADQGAQPAGGHTAAGRVGAASAGPSGYRLLETIHLGGDGRWDTLTFDAATRRLFISRETHVVVLDVDTANLVGEIPDTQGVHAIALVPDLGRGFTSNGRTDTVTIFDLRTLATTGHALAGQNPDALVYEPVSHDIFAMNGHSDDATVIHAATGAVIATIPLDGKPEFAVADGAGRVYVNLEDKSEVLQIDARARKVTARWPLAPCEGPSGLAMDTAHGRLFAGCANRVMVVVNADSGKVIATLPIGGGVDGTGFDPGAGLVFSSNGEGTLTVVRQDSPDVYRVLEDVPTQRGARTMTLDPTTQQVFLVTADFGPTPAPTADNPRPRPPILPDSFRVLVFGRR